MASGRAGAGPAAEGAPRVGRSPRVARSTIALACVNALCLTCGIACVREKKVEQQAAQVVDTGTDEQVVDASVAAAAPTPTCEESPGVFLFVTPATPYAGAPLRVVAISDKPLDGAIDLSTDGADASTPSATPSATPSTTSNERRGGPPYFWTTQIASPSVGAWTATFHQTACSQGQNETALAVTVADDAPPHLRNPWRGVWTTTHAWSHAYENLYSAWIEALFDAPPDEQPSWNALHEIIRDPKRNWLYERLASGEDDGPWAPVMHPDCADLPYFLRAYFAFKLGLPFGIGECDRGGEGFPPSCKNLHTNEDDDERATKHRDDGPVAMFAVFLAGTVSDFAHSGSARAPFADEDADYYPVSLDWKNLRPGTVYADPYGHTLLIAKKLAQDDTHGGVLFAVDGQPDGTVARKRFWRGNFLYAHDPALGGPGFKRFRPIARKWGVLVRWKDEAITASPEYGDLSREAETLDVDAFYDRIEDVLSPKPLDAQRALMETIAALEEQVKTRVNSVDNGRKWLEKHEPAAPMPEGADIFETNGPWEDFSTPSRDLRLLIAIDVVRGFPARVEKRKEHYASFTNEQDLQAILDRELGARSIVYTRTEGSSFTLTLAEVLARSTALETAYDPNDCVEVRWGAPPGSDEMSTCKAHAPWEQHAKMEEYRPWFHDRKRPPRK
jgi:hypothetical protein